MDLLEIDRSPKMENHSSQGSQSARTSALAPPPPVDPILNPSFMRLAFYRQARP